MEHIFSLEFLKKLSEQLKKREIKGLPEQIAFNLVMAIVPLLVVIVQLGTYLSLNTDLVEYLIMAYAPNELKLLLMNLFQQRRPLLEISFSYYNGYFVYVVNL